MSYFRIIQQYLQQLCTCHEMKDNQTLHAVDEKPISWFSIKKRWQIAILGSVGFMIAFGIRCNFGAAKLRMTNNFTDPLGINHTKQFFWTATELSVIESAFFYGYAITQIPGGLLAIKFPPNRLFGLAILITAVLNIFLALALSAHPAADHVVIIIQVCQGLALGFCYPAMHGIWRHWAPPIERSKLAATSFTGTYAGVMAGLALSTLLTSCIDWYAPFLFYGMAGIVWAAIWFHVSAPTPALCRRVNKAERKYIMDSVGHATSSPATLSTIPWKTILSAPPVWAIIICSFCRSWTFSLLISNQLTYMEDILGMGSKKNVLIAPLPHLAMAISVPLAGHSADYLRSTKMIPTPLVRKSFNTIGFAGEAVFLCCLAFIEDPTLAIVCLISSAFFSGFSIAGFNVNHFDIAPRYAPILMGFSNGIGALAGISVFVLGHLIHSKGKEIGWKTSFLIAVVVDVIAIIIFLILGKCEIQEWAKEEPSQSLQEIVGKLSKAVNRVSLQFHTKRSTVQHYRLKEDKHNDKRIFDKQSNMRTNTL